MLNTKFSVIAACVASAFAVQGAIAAEDGTYTGSYKFINQNQSWTGENVHFIYNKGSSQSDVDGIAVRESSAFTVGGTDTKTIVFDYEVSASNNVAAVFVRNGDSPDPSEKGPSVDMTATDSITINSNDVGIWMQNNTETSDLPTNHTTVNLKSKDITITADNIAIAAFSNSEINLESTGGAIELRAEQVIDTRGNSLININKNGAAERVVLEGDIFFETPILNSGNLINSSVNLVLEGADSSWTGDVFMQYPSNVSEETVGTVKGMSLTLTDGAAWVIPAKTSGVTLDAEATVKKGIVNTLTLDGGIVTINDIDRDLKVGTLTGEGTVVLAAKAVDAEEGQTFQTASFSLAQNGSAKDAKLNVGFSGITADDVDDPEAAMKQLAGAVAVTGAEQTITVEEGDINGAITTVVDAEGNQGAAVQGDNTKLDGLTGVTVLSALQWRHETNDLIKRMGELRDSPEGVGAWVRLYGSEQAYDKRDVTLESTSVQVGSDYRLGDWTVGGSFSYTDGSADLLGGDADTESYGLAVYGTWLADNGMFVDLIGKYSRLENDFSVGNMKGDSKNNAFSVSAEVGWRFEPTKLVFVEPQAELTYGRIAGDDFTASNGVSVTQDDYDTLLGRIGARAGFNLPDDRGNVYLRVSGVYDFQGEAQSTYVKGSDREAYKDDLGGGWVEYALGANVKLTETTYSYVDFERTSGGDIEENWRWNVGLRTVF